MATKQVKKVRVDFNKLRAELKKRNVTLQNASLVVGYADTYLNCAIHNNSPLKEASLRLLEVTYGINPEDVILKEEPVVKEEPETQTQNIGCLTEDALYKIIYTATYNAMKQALSE